MQPGRATKKLKRVAGNPPRRRAFGESERLISITLRLPEIVLHDLAELAQVKGHNNLTGEALAGLVAHIKRQRKDAKP